MTFLSIFDQKSGALRTLNEALSQCAVIGGERFLSEVSVHSHSRIGHIAPPPAYQPPTSTFHRSRIRSNDEQFQGSPLERVTLAAGSALGFAKQFEGVSNHHARNFRPPIAHLENSTSLTQLAGAMKEYWSLPPSHTMSTTPNAIYGIVLNPGTMGAKHIVKLGNFDGGGER